MRTQAAITERQKSELVYHAEYAKKNAFLETKPVDLRVCNSSSRRWWNGYWALYDLIRALPLQGKRVLVPGCGFGEDCIRIAERGASVHGIDLSPEIAHIAAERAKKFSGKEIKIETMPTERLSYADGFFDTCVLINILHHVDISQTMAEVLRVTKPGAHILGLEMYTHSAMQKIRTSAFVKERVYPFLVKGIYGKTPPYITPDERKLNEVELDSIVAGLADVRVKYFHMFSERFFSSSRVLATKIDQLLCESSSTFGRVMAGRVLFQAKRP